MKTNVPGPGRKAAELREGAAYLLFGALTTLVNWGVYLALTEAFRLRVREPGSPAHALIAGASSVAAWALSVLFAYATNKRFVFRSAARGKAAFLEFLLFVSARVLSLLLFDVALFSLSILWMDDRIAKLLMNVLVVVFNYVASRLVIFKGRGPAPSVPPAAPLGQEEEAQQLKDGPHRRGDVGQGRG